MTKSFDEWFKGEIPNSHKKVGKEKIETFVYETAQGAWNFKQAEVDELQKRIDDVTYKLNNIKNDALRGHRHDYDKGWRDCAITILNDLKGDTNDH